ncbi:MAG: hypothetical protein A3G40_11420 [Deltaproteobacteria bacterium RIFCSPLOWO2_12_FULL_57_22]|nr:MAG: hypothetical protein A3G40_11420 [Deltaproteobacteria bacterium RIFCSPLOWO2_12_FULL_57_22]
MRREDEVFGTAEDIVRDSMLVDRRAIQLAKFAGNACPVDPEKRNFPRFTPKVKERDELVGIVEEEVKKPIYQRANPGIQL